jgi:hypothetical protein
MSVILPNKIASGWAGVGNENSIVRWKTFNQLTDALNVKIDNDGQVIIGSSSASAMLDIQQRLSSVIALELNGANNRSVPLLKLVEGAGTPTGDLVQISNKIYIDKDGKIAVGNSIASAMLDIVQLTGNTGIELNGAANRASVLLQIKEGTGTPTGNILEINSNAGSDGDYLCINKLGNIKTLKADPYLNSVTNFFLGYQSGGAGTLAQIFGTGGENNIAIGDYSLYSATYAGNCIVIGGKALYSNTSGSDNIAIGYKSLYSNNIGVSNIAIGSYALYYNTGTSANTAIGGNALYNNINGDKNVACGCYALEANISGIKNVAFGNSALNNALGNNNIGLGYAAGYNLTSGSNNIIIGNTITFPNATGNNQLNIGDTVFGDLSTKKIGINEPAPESALEITHTEPYITLHNNTEEDSDGGRESKILFKGEQSGAEETTLASIVAAHDGASDDEKGYIQISTNDGSDGDSPKLRVEIDSSGSTKIGDGGVTNYVNISENGILLKGTARVWKCIELRPQNIGLPSANPPLRDDYQGFQFDRYDRSTEEQLYHIWHVPECFSEGNANIAMHFDLFIDHPPSGTGDENIVMGCEYKKLTHDDGDVFDFSSGTSTILMNVPILDGESAYKVKSSEISYLNTTNFKKHDVILIRFFRDATNPNDTYNNEAVASNNDAWVFIYHLEFLRDNLGGDIE